MQGSPSSTAASRATLQRLHEQAFQVTGMGGWECDLATERLTWTPGLYAIHDLDPDIRLERRTILDLYTEPSRRQVEAIRADAIHRCGGFSLDVEVHTGLGNVRWVRITAEVAAEEGRPVRIFGAQRDVTAERVVWESLRRRAEIDPLTGLANRGVFDGRYREIVLDRIDHGGVGALVLADLDQFKAINDGFGHAAGDECLRHVAVSLRRQFPAADLIARLGGDEFALLLRAPLDAAGLSRVLARATAALRQPVFWNGQAIAVSVSLGGVLVEGAGSLFERADATLYAAKAAERAFQAMTTGAAAAAAAGRTHRRVANDDPLRAP